MPDMKWISASVYGYRALSALAWAVTVPWAHTGTETAPATTNSAVAAVQRICDKVISVIVMGYATKQARVKFPAQWSLAPHCAIRSLDAATIQIVGKPCG